MTAEVNGQGAASSRGGRVTIVDLARELQVSKTTVADALAGSGRVSRETRKRIEALAAERGYVSNRAARSLRGRSVGALGLYVPAMVRVSPFYMEFALGGAQRAAEAGFDLTLFAPQPVRTRGFGVDGAVVIDMSADDEMPQQLVAAGVPIVAAGRILGHDLPQAVIQTPDAEMAVEMLGLMRARGARRIAFLTPLVDFAIAWAVDVTDAYRGWCARAGQEPLLASLSVSCSDADLEAALDDLVREPGVDAVVLAVEGWAARAKPMLAARGLEVSGGFQIGSLAGDPVTETPDPAISSVDLRAREFGEAAFELLLDVLSGKAEPDAVRVQPATLVPAAARG